MRLILGERATGKTDKLLEISEKTGAVLVVKDKMEALKVDQYMKVQNRSIPYPITYDDLIYMRVANRPLNLLIDNVNDFLQYIAGKHNIEAISFGVEPFTQIDVGHH